MLMRGASHLAHLLTEAVIGLLGVCALAACVLAWRLAQGPIDVTALAQRAEASLAGPGARVSIGSAAIAWEGFRRPDRALDLRLGDIRVTRPDGSPIASVPQARATLAMGQLVLGRIVPRTLDLEGAVLAVRRDAQGAIQIDLDPAPPADPQAPGGGGEILRELARPASPTGELPWLSQLRRVSVKNAQVTVRDAALGVIWQAPQASIDLKRLPDGGVSGAARLDLAVGEVRATLAARAELRAGGTHVTVTTTPVSPALLSRAAPRFSALAAVDAPVSMSLEADLDPSLSPLSLKLDAQVGPGSVAAGNGTISLQAASMSLSASSQGVSMDALRIALEPVPGAHGPPPVITGHAHAVRGADRIGGDFALDIPSLDLSDLQRYWPPGTGGGSRGWLVENISAGLARSAHVEGTVDVPTDLSDATLKTLSGGFEADQLVVSWLKPIPAIEHGHARVVIDGPDVLHVDQLTGDQGGLRVTGGQVRITGLAARHQFGDIEVSLAGPLAEALRLLDHPRLKLLSKRNLDFRDPAGTVAASLSVKLPLEDRVSLDDITIGAHARLASVHLGNVAAGRALDRGDLTLDIGSDGLKLAGNGDFAGIPSKAALDMDFRLGPKSQVLEHVVASGTADGKQLIAAGAPAGVTGTLIKSGTAALSVDYAARRDGSGAVSLSADLGGAALASPLGWSKPAGPAASLSARLLMQRGAIVGLDSLAAGAPGLTLASHAELVAGRLHVLAIDRADLGRTRAHGRIVFPASPADPVQVTLAGPRLDLSSRLDAPKAKPADPVPDEPPETPETRGQPWQVSLSFDEVLLAKDARLQPLRADMTDDGLRIAHATIRAGGERGISADIVPQPGGRRLALDTHDAGTTLAALGLGDTLHGGRLVLDAAYDDTTTPAPLAGTATLSEFNVKDAPVIGRLLQAMTLYGLADLLRGPGLHFSKMVAPFRWQSRVLHLDNARAFSSSLGLTAQGDIDLRHHAANLTGTVVPAYFFNQLPGKLPLVGRLFSPEKGGGLFAASYAVRGKLSDPSVSVNPLSALTPGFLRGVFGLF